MPNLRKIVLTGGPGGGKTTAADLYRRELGETVVVVPETATLLYTGGFPRIAGDDVRHATQKAIYAVQKNLEDAYKSHYHDRILLCDRGTVDGAAYWPSTEDDYFTAINSTLEAELSRYDTIIFFQTAAVGDVSIIEGGNPTRVESNEQALRVDKKLEELWSQHPNFHYVPHNPSFMQKIEAGLEVLQKILSV